MPNLALIGEWEWVQEPAKSCIVGAQLPAQDSDTMRIRSEIYDHAMHYSIEINTSRHRQQLENFVKLKYSVYHVKHQSLVFYSIISCGKC